MYNDRINKRIERYRKFFSTAEPDQIMVCVSPYTFEKAYDGYNGIGKKLNEWKFPNDIPEYISCQINNIEHFLEITNDIDDDYVPNISPFLGVGFLCAMMTGQDVIFTEDTSWSHEIFKDYNKLEELDFNRNNRHQRLMQNLFAELTKKQKENFTIGSLSHFAPIDMANAVRGNNLFYDYYDNPEPLKLLLYKIADYTIKCEENLKEITGYVQDGYTTASMWLPGKGLFMSEDAADLGSSETYKNFAMPATQKILNHFGGGYVHHHAKGWQIHKEIASLKNMTAVEFSWDPNCERPVDHLEELYEYHSHLVPLQIRCRPEDVYKYIDIMRKFRLIIMLNVDSVQEGIDVVNFLNDQGVHK